MPPRTFLPALLLSLLLTAPARAQTTPVPATIRVQGEAILTVEPDLAELELGVVSQAKTAAAAAAENATKLDRVMRAVRGAMGANDKVNTIGYNASPMFRDGAKGAPVLDSYVVTNTIRVRAHELPRVGRLIDAALGAGANNVQRLGFTLAKPEQAQSEALKAAAANARAEAAALAGALSLSIVRVLTVEETSGGPRPMVFAEMSQQMERKAMATPITPGQIDVPATVTITYQVTPAVSPARP